MRHIDPRVADPAATVTGETPASDLQTRRQSLKSIGRFAAATAPAMLVLLRPGEAGACHGGNGNGNGNGNGQSKHSFG